LYLAFDDSNSNGWVLSYNGSSWATVGGGAFSNKTAGPIGLTVDIYTNTLYVAFSDENNSDYVSVEKAASGSWQYVGAPGFSGGVPGTNAFEAISLVASSGVVDVAFDNLTVSNGQVWQSTSGGAWSLLGGGTGFSTQAIHPTLALINSNLCVGFEDVPIGNEPSVMTYSGWKLELYGSAGVHRQFLPISHPDLQPGLSLPRHFGWRARGKSFGLYLLLRFKKSLFKRLVWGFRSA
jgi:hypothetical protein